MSDSIEREIDNAVENRVSDADIETTLRSDSGKLRRVMELGAFTGKVFFLTRPRTDEPLGDFPWYGKVIGPDRINEGRISAIWSGEYKAESGAVEAVKEKMKREHENRKRLKEQGLIEEQRDVEAGGWYDDDDDDEEHSQAVYAQRGRGGHLDLRFKLSEPVRITTKNQDRWMNIIDDETFSAPTFIGNTKRRWGDLVVTVGLRWVDQDLINTMVGTIEDVGDTTVQDWRVEVA